MDFRHYKMIIFFIQIHWEKKQHKLWNTFFLIAVSGEQPKIYLLLSKTIKKILRIQMMFKCSLILCTKNNICLLCNRFVCEKCYKQTILLGMTNSWNIFAFWFVLRFFWFTSFLLHYLFNSWAILNGTSSQHSLSGRQMRVRITEKYLQ